MNSPSDSIALRGKIALAFAFLAMLLLIVLNEVGVVVYNSCLNDAPTSPTDRGLWDRICLVTEAMIPACLLVGAFAQCREQYASLLDPQEKGGGIVPYACGVCGLALFIRQWVRWGPYTGKHYVLESWRFALPWLLLWWCFVFLRFRNTKGSRTTTDSRWKGWRR